MLEVRDEIESNIWWEPRNGNANFWFDNWTRLDPLIHLMPSNQRDLRFEEVNHFMKEVLWNKNLLRHNLPSYLVEHIMTELPKKGKNIACDKPWFLGISNGNFTVKSSWEICRQREETQGFFHKIWTVGLPYKISFFLWRVWKKKLLVDDVLASMMINIVSRYRCYEQPHQENLIHFFLNGDFARDIWNVLQG